MNETLQQSIDSINAKIASLTQRMEALKSQNAAMTEEIQSFKEQLHEGSQRESQLLETIEKLNQDLSLANKQVIELSQRPTGRSAEEIDELVKEIDYCIEQLKK
jgi:chromosome segregation ATPase